MSRLRFRKEGSAIWVSHLDLMHDFQRCFLRAGLKLKHTQGFNPHPSVSIALPLSVGTESECELMEFELTEEIPLDELPGRLNPTFPAGLTAVEAYDGGRKLRELTHLRVWVTLEYDGGIPDGAAEQIQNLFNQPELIVQKKSKNGPVDTDIRPMIKTLEIAPLSQQELRLDAVICAQNPSLNPDLLAAALAQKGICPPDFARSRRIENLDALGEKFR